MMPAHAHGAAFGQPLDLLAFLTLGVLGSAAHCVGMCAPFVLLVSRRYALPAGRHTAASSQVWYTAGRLTTYAVLGAAAGAFGGLVQQAGAFVGLQRTAALVAGAALVVSAAASLLAAAPFSAPSRLLSRATAAFGARMPGHPLWLGLVLGLLPCGLLYSAVVAAMTRDGALAGAAAMAAFGLGTAPALAGVALADRFVVTRRVVLTRLSHVFVLAMGVWYLWRGVAPMTAH
jgi:sulfite exporter TauE/SafE